VAVNVAEATDYYDRSRKYRLTNVRTFSAGPSAPGLKVRTFSAGQTYPR
jgi:hypothetical protein